MDLDMELDKKLHLENSPTYGYCFRVTKNVCSTLVQTAEASHQLYHTLTGRQSFEQAQ